MSNGSGIRAYFRQLAETADCALLLGGEETPSDLNRWLVMGLHARQTIRLNANGLEINGQTQPVEDAADLFARLEAARQACRIWPEERAVHGLPMAGGLAGAFGYGFARWCDAGWRDLQLPEGGWPDLLLFEFEDWLFVDLETGRLVVLSDDAGRKRFYLDAWADKDSNSLGGPRAIEGHADFQSAARSDYLNTFEASFTQPDFETAVEALKEDIADGEIYQANLSIRFQKELRLNPLDLFDRLCARNPSPFAAFLKCSQGAIVCNSPERLIQMDAGGRMQTRPIAGTRGRGQTPEEDAAIGQSLLENEKERAEHLMLVDLSRNDLGRVCEAGSVQVDDLLILERYSHVTHLVSNVTGQLRGDQTPWDVIRSLFPGGTITGCPKIRCVEILSRMETAPRGFYTGSLGYLDAASPALDLNILIRSVFLLGTARPLVYNAAIHAGAGIVHDAVGAYEYKECLRKTEAIMQALHALETRTDAQTCTQT